MSWLFMATQKAVGFCAFWLLNGDKWKGRKPDGSPRLSLVLHVVGPWEMKES